MGTTLRSSSNWRIRKFFAIVSVDKATGEERAERMPADVFWTREEADTWVKGLAPDARYDFRVAEFRRVDEAPAAEGTVTLTAPEGTIGAIGTSLEDEDSEKEAPDSGSEP